jgi:ParB-like chromosome segregation protein Spo0J
MPELVKMAFEHEVIVLPLSDILPIKRLPDSIKQAMRYKRIVASIAEVGIVEPIIVARRQDETGPYMLVDGHLRHAALMDLGNREAPCLIADDDEAFTYNKRVNRLATIQEHYMIVKAIERGVSEEKLARTLNVDIKRIKTKRTLLDGVCPEVAEMLKDKSVDTAVFALLRKMKPLRQIEAVELMSAMNNFTARYAQALLAATRQDDLTQPARPKKIGGLSAEQMARMEREMDGLQREFKAVSASYGDIVLNLVVASGYLSSLLRNPRVSGYLERRHPEILSEFKAIVAATSLEGTGSGESEQLAFLD